MLEARMNLGPTELIIILAIVLLLFGVGRLSRIGGELGRGIREFRTGLKGDDEDSEASTQTETSAQKEIAE
jgi:sec-independent protein translocase protein TatA